MKIGVEEARLVVAFFFVSSGSSLLTRDLVLELFGNSTSNTSKLLFMSLLYSLRVGNIVIIHSVSVVLELRILVDTPCLAKFVVVLGGGK